MQVNVTHELDVRQDFFSDILSGKKKHEVRKINETPFQEGDIIALKEVGFFKKEYTGRELIVKVTYVTPIEIGEIYKFAICSIEILEGKGI